MVQASSLLKYWIFLLLSVAVFFLGLHVGKEKSLQPPADCPLETVITHQADGSVVVRIKQPSDSKPMCDKQTPSPGAQLPAAQTTAALEGSRTAPPKPLCYNDQPHKLSALVKGKATVPEDVFPYLHHPASPAKECFFLSETPRWKSPHVLDAPCNEIYLTRTGSRANQPNKCVAVMKVPDGHEPMVQQSYRVGYTARNTNQYQQDYPRNYDVSPRENPEYQMLLPFLRSLESLKAEFHRKLGDPFDASGKRRTAIVMVANEGVLDLLLNFMCSAEAARIDMSSIIVFVGDERHIPLIENMGAQAMYSPAMGAMPSNAAGSYLDATFSRMMWCKATVVYLALYAGFEVLFQDVDLVWLRDPMPFFHSVDADLVFMDDGARTPRYTPFFVNSGFYHVKHTPRSLYMFESMTKAGSSEIGQTHSHQSVLIRHISEAHHLFGLSIYVLDNKEFPSGQAYHENKPLVKRIQQRQFRPFVFHMCWTDNRENKVVYFKDVGLWYLPDAEHDQTCNSGAGMLAYTVGRRARGKTSIMDRCCQRKLYWPPER